MENMANFYGFWFTKIPASLFLSCLQMVLAPTRKVLMSSKEYGETVVEMCTQEYLQQVDPVQNHEPRLFQQPRRSSTVTK